MWKIYSLIWLPYLFSILAGVAALLLAASFTRKQRERWPILGKLDGKKVHLLIAAVVFTTFAGVAQIYKETLVLESSFEWSYGPRLLQGEKATANAITIELQQSATERIEEAKDYFNAGERYFQNKKYTEAAGNYQQSLNVTPTLSAYLNLALSLRYLSEYQKAEPVLLQGLQLARGRGERKFEGLLLLTLGAVFIHQDKGAQADETLRRSLEILTEVGDTRGQANAIFDIGVNAYVAGKPDEALARYQEALKLFQGINNILGQANVLNNVGLLHIDQFNLTEALAAFQLALDKYREIDNPLGEMLSSGNKGDIYGYQGKYQDALNSFQSAIQLAKGIPNPEGQARLIGNVGEIYNKQGKFEDALAAGEEALKIAGEINTPYIQAHAHNIMAEAYLAKGISPKAIDHAQKALNISRNHKVRPMVHAEALNTLGEIHLKEKNPAEALRFFGEAFSINSSRAVPSKLRSLRGMGTAYSVLGKKEDALTSLRQAQEIYKNAGIHSPDSMKVEGLIDQLD